MKLAELIAITKAQIVYRQLNLRLPQHRAMLARIYRNLRDEFGAEQATELRKLLKG